MISLILANVNLNERITYVALAAESGIPSLPMSSGIAAESGIPSLPMSSGIAAESGIPSLPMSSGIAAESGIPAVPIQPGARSVSRGLTYSISKEMMTLKESCG